MAFLFALAPLFAGMRNDGHLPLVPMKLPFVSCTFSNCQINKVKAKMKVAIRIYEGSHPLKYPVVDKFGNP